MMSIILFFLFQIAWFSCVILAGGEQRGLAWLPMICFSCGYVLISSEQRKVDVMMMLCSSMLGFCCDSILIYIDAFSTPQSDSCSPLWLVSMWTGFATAFSMGLHKIRKLPWFFILLISSCGGYFSYRAGAQFGGIVFNQDFYFSTISIMLEWVIAFPLLLFMYEKLVGIFALKEMKKEMNEDR
jgi:hypothetical protein